MSDDRALDDLAAQLGELLLERRWKVTTAESCTGGWISKVLTDIPGSSQWFTRGFVTYSNAAKAQMLAVPADLLEAHGAVSEQVVEAMAHGAAEAAASELAVAVSGIAGPDGGVPGKPVGTVWFAWQAPGLIRSRLERFAGDREAVRRQSVALALDGLIAIFEAAG